MLDPSTIISALKKQNTVTLEWEHFISSPSPSIDLKYFRQLPAETLKKMKDVLNAPKNLMIIPTSIYLEAIYHPCS